MATTALLTVICCIVSLCCSADQTVTSHGKEFSFAFFTTINQAPENGLANDAYISSLTSDGSGCTLSFDNGTRYTIDFYIMPRTVHRVQLSDLTQIFSMQEDKSIFLKCNNTVSVYAYNRVPGVVNASDAYTILPVNSLSTEYLVPSISNNPFIGVVAHSSNTTVTVHLKSTCNIDSGPFSSAKVVKFNMNKHEVLQIVHLEFQVSSNHDCDFQGTFIQSSSPVAVFSGSVKYYLHQEASSHLIFQVPPISAYSTTIIVPHVRIPSGWPTSWTTVRVLASQDNTTVSVVAHKGHLANLNSSTFQMDHGEVYDYIFDANYDLIVYSDKPVLVVQTTIFSGHDGGISMFIPGTLLYDTYFVFQPLKIDYLKEAEPAVLTIVCETSRKDDVTINYNNSNSIIWEELGNTTYSVGTTNTTDDLYIINSGSPILVRLHQYVGRESYSFIAGYETSSLQKAVQNSVHLQCLTDNWLVTVDMDRLSLSPLDISNIYFGVDTCIGTWQDNQLIFNITYNQCHTEETVSDGKIVFKNSLIYASVSTDNVIRGIKWVEDVTCSHPLHGTDTAHVYPVHNTTNHFSTSGDIQKTPVSVSLFKDSSFQAPLVETKDKAELGKPIYVQVSATATHSLIMLINSCHAHLTNDSDNIVSHPLISKGCPVDNTTKLLASRNQVSRFMFDMFDLPHDNDGIYVTCDVTFCSSMDFSPRCQLGCHANQNPAIVGK